MLFWKTRKKTIFAHQTKRILVALFPSSTHKSTQFFFVFIYIYYISMFYGVAMHVNTDASCSMKIKMHQLALYFRRTSHMIHDITSLARASHGPTRLHIFTHHSFTSCFCSFFFLLFPHTFCCWLNFSATDCAITRSVSYRKAQKAIRKWLCISFST